MVTSPKGVKLDVKDRCFQKNKNTFRCYMCVKMDLKKETNTLSLKMKAPFQLGPEKSADTLTEHGKLMWMWREATGRQVGWGGGGDGSPPTGGETGEQ